MDEIEKKYRVVEMIKENKMMKSISKMGGPLLVRKSSAQMIDTNQSLETNLLNIAKTLLERKDEYINRGLQDDYELDGSKFEDKYILTKILQQKKFRKPKETKYIRKYFTQFKFF